MRKIQYCRTRAHFKMSRCSYCSPLVVGFVLFLLIAIVTASAYKNSDEAQSSSPWSSSYYCDDALLKEHAHQLELLNAVTGNVQLKLDMYQLRLQQEFATQKQGLLDEIKNFVNLAQSSAASSSATVADVPIDVRSDLVATDSAGGRQLTVAVVLPATCAEALTAGRSSGVYLLHLPASGLKPFYVYCLQDPNNGTAWTIVQRRQEPGTENFFRDWDEYERGFGNLHGEFFLGLEQLHALTHAQLNELWIDMEDFEGGRRSARYENFAIADAKSAYALNVLGKFSGDAGNSLAGHEGRKFTTKDADHDTWDKNCAVEFTGAWWYAACHSSNLNGKYLRGEYGQDKFAKGINWKTWRGHHYSLKYTHMAIRPVN